MLREFVISIYLLFFRLIFQVMNRFSLGNKTVFVASFGDNIEYILHELNKLDRHDDVVILRTGNCNIDFSAFDVTVLRFRPLYLLSFVRGMYHLATCKVILVDNYFGFLAVTDFKPTVICVQLWHASGALKQFGLEDKSNAFRSPQAMERFQAVYNRFDYVVTGSEKMAAVFERSFGLTADRLLPTGIPQTDFFFQKDAVIQARERVLQRYPEIRDKQIILYAPTYRDDALDDAKIALDLEQMHMSLQDDYLLFVRLHPTISQAFVNEFPDFVYDVSAYPFINDLLVCSDILISDYSSIPFDFALLDRPMIFYAYDMYDYDKQRGILPFYDSVVPGPVVTKTSDVVEHILKDSFSLKDIELFKKAWTTYSDGAASQKLVQAIYVGKQAEVALKEPVQL